MMLQVRKRGHGFLCSLYGQRKPSHSISLASSLAVVKKRPFEQVQNSNSNANVVTNANPNSNSSVISNNLPIEGDVFLPPGVTSASGLRRLPCSNIFVNSNLRQESVSQAEFLKSSVSVKDCPKDGFLEFAFVGRSNVGKSSLINALVRKKQLAKTSKTPGKS
jgi:GTP-binding protein